MHLHSVLISYQRLPLTRRCLASYLETVSLPYTLTVVDNGSDPDVALWLENALPNLSPPGNPIELLLLGKNFYPGYACNRGWERMPKVARFLHRTDNDFCFRPGWCEEFMRRFNVDPKLGQLGLRTDKEEQYAPSNVGGNNVIRRQLWDKGLRYDERPWSKYPAGWSEDTLLSPAVLKLGYKWGRVKRPCIYPIDEGSWQDPYYAASWGVRRIKPNPLAPQEPGTR